MIRRRPFSPGSVDFLINSMEGGGAERAMANLIPLLLPFLEERRTRLVLLDDRPVAQSLPDAIEVAVLSGNGTALQSARALNRFWSTTGAPDTCLSFLARANCLNVALSRRFSHRAMISERIHTSSHLAGTRSGKLYAALTRLLYPRADQVLAVSGGVADDLAETYGVPRDKLSIIGNPIDADRLILAATAPAGIDLPERYILGVGRLVTKKNFALLLEAHARLGPSAPDLVLLGDGPEREALTARARALGTSERVHFKGFIANPYPAMSRAAVLAAPSRAEGFPNTQIEAMALGCPVIATDCPAGPRDVLGGPEQTGPEFDLTRGGILVPMEDADSMSAALNAVLSHPAPETLRAAARNRAARFGTEEIVAAYLDVLGVDAPSRDRRITS